MADKKLKVVCDRCPMEPFCDFVKRKIETMSDVKEEFCPLLSLMKQHVIYACGIREHGRAIVSYRIGEDEEELDFEEEEMVKKAKCSICGKEDKINKMFCLNSFETATSKCLEHGCVILCEKCVERVKESFKKKFE